MAYYTEKVNDYTTRIVMDDRSYTVIDRELKERLKQQFIQKRIKFGSIVVCIGVIIGFVSFLYLLSVVGHPEFCQDMHIADDWTMVDYIGRGVYGLACFALSVFIGNTGDHIIRHP